MFFFLVAIACIQNTSKTSDQHSELEDTLQFKKIVLQVEGMTCEGCEMTITKTLGELAGVKNVSASHLDSMTTIVFDTSLANVVLISESINQLGYKVVGELSP